MGSISRGARVAGRRRARQHRGGHGAARQPLRQRAVWRRRRCRPAGGGDARLRRPVPLQDRLRPPPRAAAAEGRRARHGDRRRPRLRRANPRRRSEPGRQGPRGRPCRIRLLAARSREAPRPGPTPTRPPSPTRSNRSSAGARPTCTRRAIAAGWCSAFPRTSTTTTWSRFSGPMPDAAGRDRRPGREAAPPRRLQAHRPPLHARARC